MDDYCEVCNQEPCQCGMDTISSGRLSTIQDDLNHVAIQQMNGNLEKIIEQLDTIILNLGMKKPDGYDKSS